VPEDYIHRIGRTGRAGATGEATSFVAPEEEKYLVEIERLLRKKVAIVVAEDFDPSAVRSERTARPDKTKPRETRPTRERAHPREDRQAERELAYARNPDQPIALRIVNGASRTTATSSHRDAKRPVAALLKKRPSPQPEKV
jgi:ATP-dependent RNA helicase RhlE